MQQLEKRFYSREEIATELKLNINDSKHFKRNVEIKLANWGYSFEAVPRKGFLITRVPTTANEKLSEILIREYDLDIQIDTYAFACFLTAFTDAEKFDAMPWPERVEMLKAGYGVNVTDRTLRNWASKLFKTGTFSKSDKKTYWSTTITPLKEKVRQWIEEGSEEHEEMIKYFNRRRQFANQYMKEGKSRSEAWAAANKDVWFEYGCCYYACKSIAPGAFDNTNHLQEIYEYVREIADSGEEPVLRVQVSLVSPSTINNKEFKF